jgi:hypothetical protein
LPADRSLISPGVVALSFTPLCCLRFGADLGPAVADGPGGAAAAAASDDARRGAEWSETGADGHDGTPAEHFDPSGVAEHVVGDWGGARAVGDGSYHGERLELASADEPAASEWGGLGSYHGYHAGRDEGAPAGDDEHGHHEGQLDDCESTKHAAEAQHSAYTEGAVWTEGAGRDAGEAGDVYYLVGDDMRAAGGTAQVAALAQAGAITDGTLVWYEGAEDWLAFGACRHFFVGDAEPAAGEVVWEETPLERMRAKRQAQERARVALAESGARPGLDGAAAAVVLRRREGYRAPRTSASLAAAARGAPQVLERPLLRAALASGAPAAAMAGAGAGAPPELQALREEHARRAGEAAELEARRVRTGLRRALHMAGAEDVEQSALESESAEARRQLAAQKLATAEARVQADKEQRRAVVSVRRRQNKMAALLEKRRRRTEARLERRWALPALPAARTVAQDFRFRSAATVDSADR